MSRAKQARLGKGLSALIGEYLPDEGRAPSPDSVRQAAVARITANPLQPRRTFAEDRLEELATSIRENGLLQPLVVRPASEHAPAGAEWELVAGERRWRAVRRLGWTEVPVVVREMDDQTLLVLAIVENVQREGLSPLDEAAGYRDLIDEFGFTQKEVAETVGRERSTIANLLRLLQLPAPVQRMVSEGALQMGHARALLGLADARSITPLAENAAREGWSVREVERRVRRRGSGEKEAEPKGRKGEAGDGTRLDPHLKRIERSLQRRLGTRVKLRPRTGDRGTIEIPFHDATDFERITDLLLNDGAR